MTAEYLASWGNYLLHNHQAGSWITTAGALALVTYEEIERELRYTGPHGIRPLIFFPKNNKNNNMSNNNNNNNKLVHKTQSLLMEEKHRSSSSSLGGNDASVVSDDDSGSHHHHGSPKNQQQNQQKKSVSGELPPPVLVYHESARSIVFRDHLRRAADELQQKQQQQQQLQQQDSLNQDTEHSTHSPKAAGQSQHSEISRELSSELNEMAVLFGGGSNTSGSFNEQVEIQGFQPNIVPLPYLELGPNDEYQPLLKQEQPVTTAEKEVVELLQTQRATVKTIKNSDWTSFLHRFQTPDNANHHHAPDHHKDIAPHDGEDFPFNSFVTSTSLLPEGGKKMRSYGSPSVYTTGVVFSLPRFASPLEEDKAAETTRTWTWPSGYSAKTEFNIDSRGNLINGRQEAIVPFSKLREYNDDYLTKDSYMIAGRMLQGGLKTVPYNEVFLRVGGRGRIVANQDCATGNPASDDDGTGRSFEQGVGLPVALFVRTATFGHLISLLRTRARLLHVWGERHVKGIPLLLISHELGVRVLTDQLQTELLQIAAKSLNPFQNPMIAHKTTIDDTDEGMLQTKLEELIHLDDGIRKTLTPEECVRLAGGFGATDDSIAQILKDALMEDKTTSVNGNGQESHKLQDIVNEGLASAVRSGDYYTSRQLLILYSLVASEGHQMEIEEQVQKLTTGDDKAPLEKTLLVRKTSLDSEAMLLKRQAQDGIITNQNSRLPPPPPPPPLDTDRLRSATNSDGLLAVLGAAQILKAMRDKDAKKRTEESFLAVEEWCEHGEQSMAFRLASWRDQRAAQDDLQIAFDKDSSFMAFVSNKAISNRKNFASKLREATAQTDFTDARFLTTIYEIVCRMHSPCLRLELLQYVLGLDNRYSIAHVKRSIELAATCLSISTTTTIS